MLHPPNLPWNEIFSAYPEVEAAFLFGSYAADKANKLSDLDIGIVIKGSTTEERQREIVLKLLTDLTIHGVEKIDLVNLNSATPLLRHAAVYMNKILYKKEDFEPIEYIIKARKEYEDMLYYYDIQNKALKERLKQ